MTPLDTLPGDRYASDRRQADRSIRALLEVIAKNVVHLRKVDRNGKLERAARDFAGMIKRGESLSPAQRSFCENIYEKTLEAMGLPAVNVHHDRRRRSLKFG